MQDEVIIDIENHKDNDLISRQAVLGNLCNSCTNIGCEFQSGIVRTKCAFYMPPHIEPDNCGNYVVMTPVRPQEPKWVPISERLPEEDGLYLVYTEEQPFVCPFEDNGFFIDDVLAWMPLQEPYEKGGE